MSSRSRGIVKRSGIRNSGTIWRTAVIEGETVVVFPDRRLEGYVYKKGIQYFLERHADITRLQEESQT